MTFYCASGLEVDTLSSSIWTFINSISFLFINVAVCECSTEFTMLVSLTKEFYRCITCGGDLKQHVNGKISYIPITPSQPEAK